MKRRRRYLVNGPYQFRQAAGVVLANILVIAATSLFLAWFYLIVWDSSLTVDHNRQLPTLVALFGLGVLLLSLLASLYRSRKTAGMMEKLETILGLAAEGELPKQPVTFRQSDPFGSLSKPLNGCLDRLQLLEQEKRCGDEQKKQLQRLAAALDKEELSREEMSRALQELTGKSGQ